HLILGTDFGLLAPYQYITQEASRFPRAALLFPQGHIPPWQWAVLAFCLVFVIVYLHADWLKNRPAGDDESQPIFRLGIKVIGAMVVVVILTFIYQAALLIEK